MGNAAAPLPSSCGSEIRCTPAKCFGDDSPRVTTGTYSKRKPDIVAATMTQQPDSLLQHSIEAISPRGILIAHRFIAVGDEHALFPDEAAAFARSVLKVRRASGAVRIVARDLLRRIGAPAGAILKAASGMPLWPKGIVGSLAHTSDVAIAAIASCRDFAGVGIDIEPAEPLDPDLLAMVATEGERQVIGHDLEQGRLLFSIKEAVYKAVYPLDGMFLDHHDVEVNLARHSATVVNGRVVNFRYWLGSHIVAVAYDPTSPKPL